MKDIIIRAVKTFVQGFLGSMAIALPGSNITDDTVIRSLLIGGVAAGISAAMNVIVDILKEDKENERN